MIFDYIAIHYFIALILILPLLRTNKYLNAFIFYAFIMAVFEALWPFFRTLRGPLARLSINNQLHLYICYLLSFVILIKSRIDSKTIKTWLSRLAVLSIICSVLAILIVWGIEIAYYFKASALPPKPQNLGFVSGLVPNKAMNGVLTLMLLPYLSPLSPKNWLVFVTLGLGVLFLSLSSTVYMSMSVLFAFGIFAQSKSLIKPLVTLAVLGGLFLLTPHALEGGGRLAMWRGALSQLDRVEWFIGRGPGTFFHWGPNIQSKLPELIPSMNNGLNIYAHSDPIQFIFEYGLLGVPLLVPVFYMIKKYACPDSFYSLLAFALGGLLYYPAHFGLHMVVAALSLKLVTNEVDLREGRM